MTSADIPIEFLDEPVAPLRGKFDAAQMDKLVQSIRTMGVLEPLLVKPIGTRFRVIAGHRRLLASRQAGLATLPCRIMDEISEGDELAAMLHENVFRADLTPIEEGALCAELFDKLGDTELVAEALHISRDVVESRLVLLAGDEKITEAVQNEQISLGVAEQLNKVPEESTRRFLLDAAINDGASVAKVTAWRKMYYGLDVGAAAQAAAAASPDPSGERVVDPNICWLCGSSDDQHDLRVRLVHAACERMVRRNAAAAVPAEVQNVGD